MRGMMKILGTGLSGLVGSRLVSQLKDRFIFQIAGSEAGFDLANKSQIEEVIKNSDAPWVFHLAAFTNVEAAEADRPNGQSGVTWQVNVVATETLVEACRISQKRLLYFSTDYVFDGAAPYYRESDPPNPQGWYALTKLEGEKRLTRLGDLGLIVRIANPYRPDNFSKPDFVHKIALELKRGQSIAAPTDQRFVPTFIDDIAVAVEALVAHEASGVYHVVGSQALSPFAAAQKIAETFNLNSALITPTTFAEYSRGRAPRPFQAILTNDKITQLGVRMLTFDEGLNLVNKNL